MRKILAFTLAEVLITLTIIGVIAALTIPNLSRKWSDHADIQKVKSAYSILNNAFKLMIQENGPINEWIPKDSNTNASAKLLEKLSSYLKVSKYCSKSTPWRQNYCLDGVQEAGYFKMNNSSKYYSMGVINNYGDWMILDNGVMIGIMFWWSNNAKVGINGDGSYIGNVVLDINTYRNKPNMYGYDVFNIPFNAEGLFLKEYKEYPYMGNVNVKGNCNKPTSEGMYCLPWIIKHGSMDYKYRDVSAEW